MQDDGDLVLSWEVSINSHITNVAEGVPERPQPHLCLLFFLILLASIAPLR